jgi:hypothetical protein
MVIPGENTIRLCSQWLSLREVLFCSLNRLILLRIFILTPLKLAIYSPLLFLSAVSARRRAACPMLCVVPHRLP